MKIKLNKEFAVERLFNSMKVRSLHWGSPTAPGPRHTDEGLGSFAAGPSAGWQEHLPARAVVAHAACSVKQGWVRNSKKPTRLQALNNRDLCSWRPLHST